MKENFLSDSSVALLLCVASSVKLPKGHPCCEHPVARWTETFLDVLVGGGQTAFQWSGDSADTD